MAKNFNITGKCFVEYHFMADVSDKMTQALAMVEKDDYFIINRNGRNVFEVNTIYIN
jgi:hypothetical protein